MAELSAVGAVVGTLTSAAASVAVTARGDRGSGSGDGGAALSAAVPGVARSSAGLAAYFALNANTRYQLLGGLDSLLFGRSASLLTCVRAMCVCAPDCVFPCPCQRAAIVSE
jgi:hypothetical protein